MNIFGKLAVSGLVLSVASMASAASVSGSTDFRVTLPEILVLYHWDDAHLILQDIATTPGNDSDAGREISDVTSRTLTDTLGKSPYEIVGTGAVNTDVPTNALNKYNSELIKMFKIDSYLFIESVQIDEICALKFDYLKISCRILETCLCFVAGKRCVPFSTT